MQQLQLRCLEDRFLPNKQGKRALLKQSRFSTSFLPPLGATSCICNTWIPFRSFNTFEYGLADCMPIHIHERWPPSVVSNIRGVDEGSQHTFFFSPHRQLVSSSAPSRDTALGSSAVNRGFNTGLDTCFFAWLLIVTASWLSTLMNLLSPSIDWRRLFSGRPCTTMLTGLSPSFCRFAKSVSALTKLSHAPLRRSVRSEDLCFTAVRTVLYDQYSVWISPIVLQYTSLRQTNQYRVIFSTPKHLPRPTSSLHSDAWLPTLRRSFFPAQLGLAPAKCAFSVLHMCALLLFPNGHSLHGSSAHPLGRQLSYPPTLASQMARCATAATRWPEPEFRT